MKTISGPDWATHAGVFCGLVPVWIAIDESDSPVLEGRGWFADRCLLPATVTAFQFFATIFDWPFPIRITREVTHD